MKKYGKIAAWFCLYLLYEEFFLRALSGRGAFPHPVYVIGFTAGAGCVLAGLCMLLSKIRRFPAVPVLFALTGIYYLLQSSLMEAFNLFMPMETVFGELGDVTTEYGDAFGRAVVGTIPAAFVFLLPLVLYLVIRRLKRRQAGEDGKTALRKDGTGDAPGPVICGILFAGIAVTLLFSLFAKTGELSASYRTAYTFDHAVDDFGLLTAARLSLQYAVTGQETGIGGADAFLSEGEGSAFAAEPPVSPPAESEAEEEAETAAPEETPSGGEEPAAPEDAGNAAPEEPSPTPSPTPTPIVYGPNVMDLDFSSIRETGGDEVNALTDYIESLPPSMQNEYTGLFRGKNLIYITAEAWTDVYVDPELTPTMYRLLHNGIYFPYFYQPAWGGSTTSGESSFTLGLVPVHAGSSMKITAGNNNYFTLGNALQREGYNSCAFHNGSYTYYRRDTTHENLGYSQYIASENGLAELCGETYPNDTLMFEKTVPLFLDKQPFSIYYMTISGHAGYYGNNGFVSKYYDRVDKVYPDKYAEKTKYYICYQLELEEALRILVEDLEKAGIADDTVIVMTGDHYPYGLDAAAAWGNDRNYVADLFGENDSTPFVRDQSGLVLWCGSLENENKDMACTVSDPVYSLDAVPTLLNLFGVPFDSRLLPGRDVFSDEEPLILWNSGNWITREGRFFTGSRGFERADSYGMDTCTDLTGSEEKIKEYVARMNAVVENKIRMSRIIVEKDYYGLLFGPDTVTESRTPVFPGKEDGKEES